MGYEHRRFIDTYGMEEWQLWRKSKIALDTYELALRRRMNFTDDTTPVWDEVVKYRREFGYGY
jgi:hypothetical protein